MQLAGLPARFEKNCVFRCSRPQRHRRSPRCLPGRSRGQFARYLDGILQHGHRSEVRHPLDPTRG